MSAQIKNKKRVSDHGEVFTNEREVKAMLDLVKQETERVESRFLEPACGTGNFLIEILSRKLDVVSSMYKKNQFEFERNAFIAVSSIYGVDILKDNVNECIERLYQLFINFYQQNFKDKINNDYLKVIKFLLDRNILCGDTLTMKMIDGKQTPIIFSEWTAINGVKIKRRDYTFTDLLNYQPMPEGMLFSDTNVPAIIPKPIKEYKAVHFMEVMQHGN